MTDVLKRSTSTSTCPPARDSVPPSSRHGSTSTSTSTSTPTFTSTSAPSSRLAVIVAAVAALLSLVSVPAAGQTLSGRPLVDALRQGGYVIVMRHASAPRERPDAADAAPGNTDRERQLDQTGRQTATAMGEALRRLSIPVGEVLSSPTFRALETVRLLGVGRAKTFQELGEGKEGMKADKEGKRSAWLRNRAGEKPRTGTNTLIVTHLPNLVGAFGDAAEGVGDGGALIVRPGSRAEVVGQVPIDEWPKLAAD